MREKSMRIDLRSALVFVITLSTLSTYFVTTSWAADCSKSANSKVPACLSATAKPGPGSAMQTVDQAGAQAQKKAAQSTVESKTANSQPQSKEKRNWVGQTAITCKKGSVTLHLASGAGQCPDGFHKS